jgi:hypothetical protein
MIPDDKIVEMYASGIDADSIGYRAGCCGTTVLTIVRASGGTVRPPGSNPGKPLRIDEATICKLYRAGESGPIIAAAAGCAPSTVYRILRSHGVTMRDTGPRTASQNATLARRRRERRDANG